MSRRASARRRIAIVVGTRPEAIKMAPVIQELKRRRSRFAPVVVSTGQHREMLDQTFRVFGIRPDLELGVMTHAQTLEALTARLLERLGEAWRRLRPDLVLVQGDTTSSLAAALAAYYQQIPIGHIEAGLRTGEKYAPFPEEANRRLIDAIADRHFAPTESARRNLLREGIPAATIDVTGNTGIDALRMVLARVTRPGFAPAGVDPRQLADKRLVLVTGHRRENFGAGLRGVCAALRTLSRRRRDIVILYAVHRNPNVLGPVTQLLGGRDNIVLTPPLAYPTFVYAMERADLIVTDSGGIQEEIAWLGKRAIVMRDTTERGEAADAGFSRVVGTQPARLARAITEALDRPNGALARSAVFGDGYAAQRIVSALERSPAR